MSSTASVSDLPPAIVRGGDAIPVGDALRDPVPLEQLERENIIAALERSSGNKNEAARLLRIDRQRLYRKMEKYGLGT